MTNWDEVDRLESAIRDQISDVSVRAIGNDLVVRMPDLRYGNGAIVLSVERQDDGWLVSDIGYTAAMHDDSFGPLMDLFECVGAPFDIFQRADGVTALTADAESLAHVAELATSFAAHLSAAPLLAMARECIRDSEKVSKKLTAAQHLARETRDRIVSVVPNSRHFLQLDGIVSGGGERTVVPLMIGSRGGSNLPPKLISGFIDMTATASAVSAAKRAMSFTVDVVHEYPRLRKFVVIRTQDDYEFDHLADFYDRDNTSAVRSDDQDSLISEAREAVAELVNA